MKLTIITICLNIEGTIERTCKSIVDQTIQDFEWIVVDGGSSDETLNILDKYKNRIDIYISEKDKGIYDAMNKGILQAHGEYVIFMNGGDSFYDNEVLSNTLPLIKGADIYYGSTNLIQADGRENILHYPEFLPSDFFLYSDINHQSTYIKRHLFEEFGLYNTMMDIIAESVKWIVYQKNNCSFRYLPYIIANYSTGGISDTMRRSTTAYKQSFFAIAERSLSYRFYKALRERMSSCKKAIHSFFNRISLKAKKSKK